MNYEDEYTEYEEFMECEDEYSESEYEGTYVHDVEGWDDDMINDVLDGDPDAYWNID